MAAGFLKSVGLTPDEVVIRVNDRSFLEEVLKSLGISDDKFMSILRVIDRKEKVSAEKFKEGLVAEGLTAGQVQGLSKFLKAADYSGSEWLSQLFAALENFSGALDYIKFDPIIARGFDYYTRTVFEAWDKTGEFGRSLFGGGRFDDLTATLGGKRIPGVGMAPGDMPIEVLLRQFNKMPQLQPQVASVLVTIFDQASARESQKLADELRQAGISAELWPDASTKLEKQLSYADKKGIGMVAILGSDELAEGVITLKTLQTGKQIQVARSSVVSELECINT